MKTNGARLVALLFLAVVWVCNAEPISYDEIVEALVPEPEVRGITVENKLKPSINLTINFEFDSSVVSRESRAQLQTLGDALGSPKLQGRKFEIIGHTDSVGAADYNLRLSERRAQAVVEYLVREQGLPRGRLSPSGRGEAQPLEGIDPADGRNRRVEVVSVAQ